MPFPSPGDLPEPGIEPGCPALQADSLLTSLVAETVKHLPAMQETRIPSLGWEDALEKEMATHSSTVAWKIPWMEYPDRLQYMGS